MNEINIEYKPTNNMKLDKKALLYLDIIQRIALESYCVRLQVGSLIAKEDNIISYGYNGTPSGSLNCCEEEIDGELVTLRTVLHSESNAITKACKSPISTVGATMYCTHACCVDCAKLIIQSGIKTFIYVENYRDLNGIDLLLKYNIKVLKQNSKTRRLELLSKKA